MQDIVESISDAFLVLDYEFHIIRANKALEKMVGIHGGDILGKNLNSIFPKTEEPIIHEYLVEVCIEKKARTFEMYASKFQCFLRIKIFPVKEGLVINASNINDEMKQREEALLAKKNLDLLINNTKDIIWSIDKDFKLLNANSTFFEKIQQVVGYSVKLQDSVLNPMNSNSHNTEWAEYYTRALSGEAVTTALSYPYQSDTLHLIVHINPIFDDEQNVIGAGCFAFDVTEQKKMEFERNEMIHQLTQQNRNLEEFSYIISHNLRSPVASIKGLVDIIQHETTAKPDMLEMLNRSAHRLDEVITDLNKVLEVRNIISEQFERVHFPDIIQNIETLLESPIQKSKAVIQCNFDKLPFIRSSKPYINSILYNLISNAIKYRREDESPVIKIESQTNGRYYSLSIQDNGIGIDLKAFRHKLFQLYQRFHLHVEGKGLGLYMVKTQVEALGGKIEVESEPGAGTTFTVLLPIANN